MSHDKFGSRTSDKGGGDGSIFCRNVIRRLQTGSLRLSLVADLIDNGWYHPGIRSIAQVRLPRFPFTISAGIR